MKKKYLIINFIWLSIIALLIIIYLLTVKFGANDELVKYLSFGLTITSLFVGLIAIFQSFFSGDSVRRSLDKLDNASSTIANSSTNLQAIIEQFNLRFGEVPTLMSDIKKQLSIPNSTISSVKQSSKDESKKLSKEQMIEILKNAPITGKIILLAVLKSHETNKPFKLKDLFAKNAQLDFFANYSYGFLMGYVNVVTINYSLSNDIWTINNVSPNLKNIEEIIAEDLKSGEKQPWYSFLKTTKENIDKYFVEDISSVK